MMKNNVMTVDASLLLVMKNSTFAFLTDCLLLLSYPLIFMQQFSKTWLLLHHLAVWQDTLGSTKISSETGQTGEDTGQTDALRTSHFKIMLPPPPQPNMFVVQLYHLWHAHYWGQLDQ
jgi:hypothetical protein